MPLWSLGGEPLDLADAAFAFLPLPRVPLYYLLWLGDDEFPPLFKVLFDRAIETCFSASGIWLLVNLVSSNLLQGRRTPEAAPNYCFASARYINMQILHSLAYLMKSAAGQTMVPSSNSLSSNSIISRVIRQTTSSTPSI